jgi:hypothetical protein
LIAHRDLRNISSSSKLQRAPEVPLQPNTVQTLKEAHEAVRKSRFISVQATKPDSFVQVHIEEKSREIRSSDGINCPSALAMHSNSILMFQRSPNAEEISPSSTPAVHPPGSLKSASSSDSFKSAVDEQEPDIEIVREVEGVLHAFRTALEVLEKVKKRIDEEDKALRIEAYMLTYSLMKGLDINQAHGYHHRRHGAAYLRAFRDSQITIRQLQEIMAKLMGELVTTLHMYSAAYEVLSPAGFQKLFSCSEQCRIKTLFELDRLAMLLFPQPLALIFVSSSLGSRSEPLLLKKSEYEVHVSEYTVDSRLSAKYDYLLGSVRRPDRKGNDSIRDFPLLLVDEGLHGTQPVPEAAEGGDLPSASSDEWGFGGLDWDSRASTLALPELKDIAPPAVTCPTPATEGRPHIEVLASPSSILPIQHQQTPHRAKKGWRLGGWFSEKEAASDDAQPNKPIRAKLAEESSFVYDPELKRWVNKKASKDGAQEGFSATPPPPRTGPLRSVSGSPAMETPSAPRAISGSVPPQRAVSAMATSTTLGQSDGPPHQHMSAEQVRSVRPRAMAIDNCLRKISRPGATLTANAPASDQGRPSFRAGLSKAQTNRDTGSDAAQPSQVIDGHDRPPTIGRYSRETEYFSEESESYFLGGRRSATEFTLSRRRIHVPLIKEVDGYSDSEVVLKTSIPKSRGYTTRGSEHGVIGHFAKSTFDSVVHGMEDYGLSKESGNLADVLNRDNIFSFGDRSPSLVQTERVQLRVEERGRDRYCSFPSSQEDVRITERDIEWEREPQIRNTRRLPEMLVNLENNNLNLPSISPVRSEERRWNPSRKHPFGRSTSVNSLSTDSDDENSFTIHHYVAQPAPSLVQAKNQPERLWRLAYMSLNDTQPDVLHSLKSFLSPELDFDLLYSPGSITTLSNQIPVTLNTLSANQNPDPGLGDANNHKKNITKVIGAVSGTLGLENSILAWWCVTILLKVM